MLRISSSGGMSVSCLFLSVEQEAERELMESFRYNRREPEDLHAGICEQLRSHIRPHLYSPVHESVASFPRPT